MLARMLFLCFKSILYCTSFLLLLLRQELSYDWSQNEKEGIHIYVCTSYQSIDYIYTSCPSIHYIYIDIYTVGTQNYPTSG